MMPDSKIVRISQLSPNLQKLVSELASWDLIAILGTSDPFVSSSQLSRLLSLIQADAANVSLPYSIHKGPNLFPTENEFHFDRHVALFRDGEISQQVTGNEIFLQLLPKIIESGGGSGNHKNIERVSEIFGTDVNVWSASDELEHALGDQRKRIIAAQASRSSMFARSANYMGSKSSLAPAISELVHAYAPRDTTVLDLMCGSGAASGAFSQHWKTISSDAQSFSRLLALVQGGGMSRERAQKIIESVTEKAREHFNELEKVLAKDLAQEEEFFTTELNDEVVYRFAKWVAEYPRVGNKEFPLSTVDLQKLSDRQMSFHEVPYILFSRYYANLFFGIRQAAEIDSLRYGIDMLADGVEREWALGVLVCAVSACADSYGGHFAQPRIDPNDSERSASAINTTILKRSLSVTQEFAIRFLNLAFESESIPYNVEMIEGPWQAALTKTALSFGGSSPLLVYLDPPYTRDEYSRYYHVLETLVNYNYPLVDGKASVPTKGGKNRFASEFFSRNQANIEEIIAGIIRQCGERGWQCLWSYASSGMANIENVIRATEGSFSGVELFSARYVHKAQGKSLQKQIREHLILFTP